MHIGERPLSISREIGN
ncbi:hypothetical protein Nmel_008560, partial [Mimus melanotis]